MNIYTKAKHGYQVIKLTFNKRNIATYWKFEGIFGPKIFSVCINPICTHCPT